MSFEPGPHDSKVWVPSDATARVESGSAETVVIDNRTDVLDDDLRDFLVEDTALFGFGQETRYLSYPNEGTMMARSKWRPPKNVIEEIALSRDLAERDDDIAAAMGSILAAAYHGGYQNQHPDEQVEHTFEEMSEQDVGLAALLHDMHRELLISAQVNTVTIFTRSSYDIRPENVSRVITRSIAAPMVGVLPAERVRVLGNDFFGRGTLAYQPDGELALWLREFFSQSASPARQREMAREDPLAAALFLSKVPYTGWGMNDLLVTGQDLYVLNPEMVHRSTLPKGSWRYPRPLLTRDFSLLEAKRLLNVMDHALLQGGINYIVVAKKGDEKKPATQPELTNLQGIVQRASRSGVMVGDHRLNLEIIQPELKEMLNPDKRRMLGRKLAQAILRVPEFGSDETGMAVATFTELAQAVITDDRNLVINHLHRYVWRPCMKRNQSVFGRSDRPTIWTPKVILQGMDFWTQYLLKLYDRGDLPRKYMVEFGGYDYDAVKAQKQREVDNGHDDIFTPPPVPFSSPNQTNSPNADPNDPYKFGTPGGTPPRGPQDNSSGRPRGARTLPPGAPADPRRPTRVVRRTRGETVRASWNEAEEQVVRIGENTERVLGEYSDATLGRVTTAEREALGMGYTTNVGNLIVVPVNTDYELTDVQAVRLSENFSVLCGNRKHDGAILAAAFCFREPSVAMHEAEDMVIRWGFSVPLVQAADDLPDDALMVICPSCSASTEIPADACSACGFTEAPFNLSPEKQRQVQPMMPIALTVHVDGQNVTAKGGVEPGKYVYLRCPECGLVQDAAHDHCTRCGHDLTEARKGMFASLEQQGKKPTLHDTPPPPASEQPDIRKGKPK
jgi:hypothetical protein